MVDIEYLGKCLVMKVEGKRLLVVGDLHLGYEEALNKGGVFVSRNIFKEMLDNFDQIFHQVGIIDKVILLGDIKHEFGSILRQEWEDVLSLFSYFQNKVEEIIVIKGNHDVIIKPFAKEEKVQIHDLYEFGSCCFLHGDRDFPLLYEKKVSHWILGHGHPAITLSDGVKEEKYKCFLEGKYKGKEVIIVPSFVDAQEGSDPREYDLGMAWDLPLKSFNVRVVGEELKVLNFGKLKSF